MRDVAFTLYPPPPPQKMAGIRTFQFVSGFCWKMKSEEFFFFSTFEKLSEGSKFCRLLWRKNPNPSFKKAAVLRRGLVPEI